MPIPGTTKPHHLHENLAALDLELSDRELADLRALLDAHDVAGDRYPAYMMAHLGT